MAKVTGIGGIFFRSQDPEGLSAWYREHLGVPFEAGMGCAIFRWNQDPAPNGCTVWKPARPDSEHFQASHSGCSINYRVDDLEGLVEQLRQAGVAIHSGPSKDQFGIFASLLDPEGNKVELWQPLVS